MRLVLLSYVLTLCAGVLGCSSHPYVVCRGEAHCTPPLTHDEAIQAAQLKKSWADEALYVRPAQ
jgi:hypothetical protein